MRRSLRSGLLLGACAVLPCGALAAQLSGNVPPHPRSDNAVNLGLASNGSGIGPNFILFRVGETSQGADLNGDGDLSDRILYLRDTLRRRTRNLGLAVLFSTTAGSNGFFTVSEFGQGQDFNGDGDATDIVMHAYRGTTATVINSGLATGSFSVADDGHLVAFGVSEASQGSDLNGDGDLLDDVLHFLDADTGVRVNLGSSLSGPGQVPVYLHAGSDLVAWGASEAGEAVDLNGDGDQLDYVLHVHDTASGVTTNLGLAVEPSPVRDSSATLFVFLVHEAGTGVDLNGDGDATDDVFHVLDRTTGAVTNLGLAGREGSFQFEIDVDGDTAAFLVWEGLHGQDLNGDGDQLDEVVHVYLRTTGVVTNTRVGTYSVSVREPFVVVDASEAQGNGDFNGDGDSQDFAVQVFDTRAATLFNLGIASGSGVLSRTADLVIATATERGQSQDLNGDGDMNDAVLYVFDPVSGTIVNLGLAILGPARIDGRSVTFVVSERDQGGLDLNDDGDAADGVLHFRRGLGGAVHNLGLASVFGGAVLRGTHLAVGVPEFDQGGTDLNGDGDTLDAVLHEVRVVE